MPFLVWTALAAALIFATARANYTLVDSFQGSTFFDSFSFFNEADPTHGFVEYVDFDTAVQNKLVGVVNGTDGGSSVYIGVDYQNITQTGRQSVRIQSKQKWDQGLLVADILSTPGNSVPGIWPALWTTDVDPAVSWPKHGEIDIIEGVNDQVANAMTLHTTSGCVLTNSTDSFSGRMTTQNCDVNAPNQPTNAGCSIVAPTGDTVSLHGKSRSYATYGSDFNKQGGGVYVMLWESDAITFWFFPRGYVPTDITNGSPDPSSWTTQQPAARFAGCSRGSNGTFANHIHSQSLIINTAFCGDWAGEVWSSDGSAAKTGTSDCNTYVGNNPAAFANAYWLINSIKMYQPATSSSNSSSSTNTTSHAASSKRSTTALSERALRLPKINLSGLRLSDPPALKPPHASSSSQNVQRSGAMSLRAGIEQAGASETLALALAGSLVAVFSALWFS